MLELSLDDGHPITINVDAIAYFKPTGDRTQILLMSGATLTVTESYDVVAEMFNPDAEG